MQRSGNHAVINWIARQSRGSMFFLGDVRLFQNPYDGMEELEHFVDGSRVAQITLYNEAERETFKSTVYFDEVIGKFTLKSLLLYNYEDKPLSDICSNAFEQRHDEWLGISERRLDVLLIRDPYNLFASRLRSRGTLTGLNHLEKEIDLWKQYAREYLGIDRELNKERVFVNFNEWFTNRTYRRSLAHSLGLQFTDRGLEEMSSDFIWSSFDGAFYNGRAQQMKLDQRWRDYAYDRDYRGIFRDRELVSLAEAIFGVIPGTEDVLTPREGMVAFPPIVAEGHFSRQSRRSGPEGPETAEAIRSSSEGLAVPILAYHSIADDGPSELLPWRITPAVFKQQLRFLREHGYRSISLEEWADCIAGKTPPSGRPVVITFDDGYESVLTEAAPLLDAAGFRATVFAVTDRVGAFANWDTTSGPPLKLMSWDDLRLLEARGFSIGSHTTAHLDLTGLTNEEIERDSREARAMLRRELGHDVDSVAFPGGTSDARVRAALVHGGYRIGVEIADRRSTLADNIGCLPRIEILATDDIDSFARKLGQEDAPVPAPNGAMATSASRSTATKLFTTIYNDMRILGQFLEHYSRAGITEFFIATGPDFRLAIDGFGDIYNITVVETADVADHFIGGAAAVTEMRRRFQGSSEWAVIVDLDEFVEFAGDLPAIIHQAEREGANVVRAVMWDRFGREGKVVGFDPGGDLRQVFPIRARFIKNVMLGADYKGVLVKGLIDSNVAHHTFIGEVVCSRQLDLSHYKWFDGAIDRVRTAHRMLVEADKPWAVEYQRALDHYARNERFAWEEFGGELDPFGASAEDAAEGAPLTRVTDDVREFLECSAAIPGWTRGEDAEAVARASLALGHNPVIVEIGVFLGSCTVLLAGPRRRCGSGIVHCVDPFDGSGDAFSVPHYRRILDSLGGGSLRYHFDANIASAGLGDWVQVHEGRAAEIAANWTQPIDLLLLDGDQSPEGARSAYDAWAKFLKPGGILVLRNSGAHDYAEGHDGHRRLAVAEVVPGRYEEIRQLGDTMIARKASPRAAATAGGMLLNMGRERPLRVHLYAQCWNDEFMLPYFFRHYDSFVDRYIVFDDGSTDRSRDILAAHPKVELRRFVRSDPESFVISEQALSDQCWKESRGEADWVIVTDVDEHLYHPEMREYLRGCSQAGVTAIPALGFQMVGEEPAWMGQRLCDGCVFGAPWGQMMKLSIFDPNQVAEINFAEGRHRAQPVGNVSTPIRDEVLLLHYKYLGIQRTYRRQQQLRSGLGLRDIARKWGHEYCWSPAELESDWRLFAAEAVDVHQIIADAYPIERWWGHGTRAPRVGASDNSPPSRESNSTDRVQVINPLSRAAFDAASAAHRSAIASALAVIDAALASADPESGQIN